jgi:hypothetical protein
LGRADRRPTGFDNLTIRISRWNPVARRQGCKLHAVADEEPVGSDEKGVGRTTVAKAVSISSLVLALST